MRSNCCCNSHSTTRRVSCKKGSMSSVAWTRACSLPLLLLLLWDVAGWGDGVIILESMRIRHPHENRRAAFSEFSTLRPVLKKVRFQDPYGWSAKTMQYVCVFEKKRCRLAGALINDCSPNQPASIPLVECSLCASGQLVAYWMITLKTYLPSRIQ